MSEKAYIACGWYTPDYAHWFKKLEKILIMHGTPYDFRAAPKLPGGWERNTCRKAGYILDALDRYPDKTVIFLDVDCVITSDLDSLVGLSCDVALAFDVARHKRRVNFIPATGHLILNPTPKTRELMEVWLKISENPGFGVHDQETITLALGEVENLRLMNIGKTAGGVILHDSASKAACVQKVTGRQRFKHKLLSAFSLGG